MKKILNLKNFIIVGSISALLFLLITSSQHLGPEIGKKNLQDNTQKIKILIKKKKELEDRGMKVDYKSAKKLCTPIINQSLQDLEEFKKDKLKKETLLSYRNVYSCYSLSGEYLDAAKYINKIIEEEPQIELWHGELAKTMMKANKLGAAYKSAHLASQLNPSNHEWFELEGDILIKFKKIPEAQSAYQKAIQNASLEDAERIGKKIDVLSRNLAITKHETVLLDTPE